MYKEIGDYMSNFMDFLENLDDKIINETYVSDDVVDEEEEMVVVKPVRKPTKSTKIKKDASVKLIEKRIRNKLDDIGLNEKAIGDVVSYVLEDIHKISGVKNTYQPQQQVEEQQIPTNVVSRAEFLLEGLLETPSYGVPTNNSSNNDETSSVGLSNIADHASSLLG